MAESETELKQQRDPLREERRRIRYINDLVPNFFLSSADATTEEWTASKTLAEEVLAGTVTVAMVENLGRSLAKMHQLSRKSSLSDRQFSQLSHTFLDRVIKDDISKKIFTEPFSSSESAQLHPDVKAKAERLIWKSEPVIAEAKRLKAIYDTQDECLIGGNLLPEKTLIKNGVAHIVDQKVAGLGPAAFDLASYVSYFMMAYYHHMLIPENNDERHKIAMEMVNYAQKFVEAYLGEIEVSGNRQTYVEKLMSDTAAFSGILVIGRCLNSQATPAIDNRYQTSVEALDSAMLLLERSGRMKSIGSILTIGLMLIF